MIITCTSCLTKFHLDDSKISSATVKVRCSRCKHVFTFVPPAETLEEPLEAPESLLKKEEFMAEPEPKTEVPPGWEEEPHVPPEESQRSPLRDDDLLFHEEVTPLKEKEIPATVEEGKREDIRTVKTARRERKSPSVLFLVFAVLILLVFGAFYLWSELETGGRLAPYIDQPVKRLTELWQKIWGSEKEGLVIKDLNGYEERAGEASVYIIEGNVHNQSRLSKKSIRVRVAVFDQGHSKIGEKETVCGRLEGRGDMKNLSGDLSPGAAAPLPDRDLALSPGMTASFKVLFRDLPAPPKEFEVEIIEAPNL